MTPDKIADIFDPESTRVFVIAEIGSNHDQDLHLAFKTIDAAVKSGADAVKFQSLNVMDLYLKPSAEILAIHKKIDLKESWHAELSNYCKAKGTIFLCSSTSLRSVDILENLGVPAHKLASAQVATFPFLIKKVIRARKPTLLSSGLVNRQELQSVVDLFKKANHDQFAVLHCNSI